MNCRSLSCPNLNCHVTVSNSYQNSELFYLRLCKLHDSSPKSSKQRQLCCLQLNSQFKFQIDISLPLFRCIILQTIKKLNLKLYDFFWNKNSLLRLLNWLNSFIRKSNLNWLFVADLLPTDVLLQCVVREVTPQMPAHFPHLRPRSRFGVFLTSNPVCLLR